jgi:hypothetical protein
LTTVVQVGFNEAIDAASVTGSTVTLTSGGSPVSGSVTYNSGSRVASFTPSSALAYGTTYTVTVTTGIKDVAGNQLASNDSYTFTTIPPPIDISGMSVPNEGWWQTTTKEGAPSGSTSSDSVSIHIHILFAQSGGTLSLSPLCSGGIQDRCITLPRNQAGANATGPNSPGYVWVLLTSLSGAITGNQISFTFTNANGRSWTFNGTLTNAYSMTGTLSGATLPAEVVTFTRPVPP